MNRYKFSDLLRDEERVKSLYSDYGLRFNPTNRISQYFSYLRNIEQARKENKDSVNKLIEKNKAKYYFSLFYVLEISNIVKALENTKLDSRIVKQKLIDLAKGTYLLSEESSNNTKARDTTFELSLFSFLHSKGLDISLEDPNPDLKLASKRFVYNIECKRPFSEKSLEEHIEKAVKQLEKTKGENVIPTIALSLEQILFGNDEGIDFILDSKDGKSALSRLDAILQSFLEENNKLLGKVCSDKPLLVLYYVSCLTGLKAESIMANATFVTGNVFNYDEDMGKQIVEDLYTLIPQNSL